MFGATLLLCIRDHDVRFRLLDERSIGKHPYPAIFEVTLDEQAERSDLASALEMAVDEAAAG